MNPFLTSAEIAEMHADYEQLVRSPEACLVRMEYKTWLDPNALPDIDPVYNIDRRLQQDDPIVVPDITCIQQIIKPKDTQFLASNLMEIGDCIFYFSDQVNLAQPQFGYACVPGTLVLYDVAEQAWVPKFPDGGRALYDTLILRVGDRQIGQPLACHIKK